MRVNRKYSIKNNSGIKQKLLQWSQQFSEIIWLDSNDDSSRYKSYDALLAVEAFTNLKTDHFSAFEKLQNYQEEIDDWIFGYLSYDLKNDVGNLKSENFDGLDFPELYFFQPKKVFLFKGENLEVHYLSDFKIEMDSDWEEILQTEVFSENNNNPSLNVQQRISKTHYVQKVDKMLRHIRLGDIYEANFCQEFYAENAEIDTINVFRHLNEISKPPFSSFLRLNQFYALSASPERYLKRVEEKIISQPIKGTAKRSENLEEDEQLKENLKSDPKEISENVMIVDLVRNDLSRTANRRSVWVEELCVVYSFKQVHQLISTVVSEVKKKTSSVEILKTTFPMGSMTGAPKISAMQIIEDLEESKRGLYSGAIGYFEPNGNFDFNVVIRSVLYNSAKKYVSFSVGSAITAKSDPEKEYEECLLKAKAMQISLGVKPEF